MVLVKKRSLVCCLILIFVATTACEALPVDFWPLPPTLIPGNDSTVTPTRMAGLVTSTAPGFPTQSVFETQVLPENTPAATLSIEPAETLPPPDTASPILPTPTPRPDPFFVLQPGNPMPLMNFLKPELGCNWMGIGGQIFNLLGEPLINYIVQIEGELGNQQISVLGLTGGALQLGPGGYLLEIATQPIESNGMLYLKVLDLDGRVLSDQIFITTYSDCEKSFILVNFSQLPAGLDTKVFLPSVSND